MYIPTTIIIEESVRSSAFARVRFSTCSFVPESPRWLVKKQRYDEARDILHFIADVNKQTLPEKMNFEDVNKNAQ